MPQDIGYGVPENYNYINMYNSSFSPSTVHVKNTGLQRFFKRYLFQKAVGVFKWTLPDTWNPYYFKYVLFAWGFIGVVETDKFGVICQAGAPYGYDIYYHTLNASMPQFSTSGTNGSFLITNSAMETTFVYQYYQLVDEDISHKGRPLCEIRQISTLSGYILCADGEFNISCLDEERTMISDFLTGGFFWE